jgi:hypothetical protein
VRGSVIIRAIWRNFFKPRAKGRKQECTIFLHKSLIYILNNKDPKRGSRGTPDSPMNGEEYTKGTIEEL